MTQCTHCGLEVPRGLIREGEEHQFCCHGCRSVYAVIHEHGLDQAYRIAQTVGDNLNRGQEPTRSYEEFDDPAFAKLHIQTLKDGRSRIHFYLEGVHCAACVWLVEKVPLVIPGVHEARLDVRRSRASITWNPEESSLQAIARFIDGLGYPVHPWRGAALADLRKQEDRRLLLRIGVAGACAGNVMLIAIALYGGFFAGMEQEYETFFRWVSLLITLPAVLYSAAPFFQGAWGALKMRSLHMDLPISLGILAGFLTGAAHTIMAQGEIYFDSLTMLILLLLAGRWLERRRQRESADAAELLYSLAPNRACRIDANGEKREIPVEALQKGDTIEILAGDTLPADGLILDGRSTLDTALLTGESIPMAVEAGSRVHAGTLNLSARLLVKVESAGENTRVGRLMQIVEEAARRKAPIVRLADRLAGWFVGAVLFASVLCFIIWWNLDPTHAIDHTVALLIVSCPCALGLATPLAVSVAVGRAARAGIFLKGGDVVEALARGGRLFLDKTGTLTQGRLSVTDFELAESYKEAAFKASLTGQKDDAVESLLRRILALESQSQHPVARSLVSYILKNEKAAIRKEDFESGASSLVESENLVQDAAGGISGSVEGHSMMLGSPRWLQKHLGTLPAYWNDRISHMAKTGGTPVLVAEEGVIQALFCLEDPLHEEAKETLDHLISQGWKPEILSGDHPLVVGHVASQLGISGDLARGAMTPEEKLKRVEETVASVPVMMVGDGVNDAAALSAATVGISVHGGAEASLAAADVFLTTPGPAALTDLVEGAQRTMGVIKRNLVFSLAYNLIFAGLAMAGKINPLLAAVLMPLSSLTVVTISFRSRTFLAKET